MAFFILGPSQVSAQVVINEVLASNRRAAVDEDQDTPDYVELYNSGASAIALGGYGLSNDEAEPHRWTFPDISLAPQEYLLIWCSGKDRVDPPHTNFRLASDGERVFLTNPEKNVVDEVDFPAQSPDRSFGRFPDGTGEFEFMVFPTPGEPNDGHTSTEPIAERLILFEPESGKYSEPIDVAIAADAPWAGFEIRYTRNGAAPTAESSLYDGPIQVTEDTVIRTVGVLDGQVATDIVAKSYFGLSRFTRRLDVPVISISMDPADFEFVHLSSGNRGIEFERAAHMEIFQADGTPAVESGFGIRLHGASNEGDIEDKKAYRAHFRNAYGNGKLRYRLFSDSEVDSFNTLVLRARSVRGGGISDQVLRDLHEDMGGLISHGTWYNLLVNMEYRGVYNVQERIESEFLGSYVPEDGENWDVIKTGHEVRDGDAVAWNQLKDLVIGKDLRDDALFDEVRERIDLGNFASYLIVNIWAQNHDWPANNWYLARPRRPDAPRPDGRWIFLVWDGELALGPQWPLTGFFVDSDTFAWAHSCEAEGAAGRDFICTEATAPIGHMFGSMLSNRSFQRFFLEEFDRHVDGALAATNAAELIKTHVEAIQFDILEDHGFQGADRRLWAAHVEFMTRFAEERGPIIRDLIVSSDKMTLPIAISAIPKRIEPQGEVDVTLEGFRFTESTEVFFGDVPSPKVELVSATELRVTVPFAPSLEGTPEITLVDPEGGSWTAKDLLEVAFGSVEQFRRGDADGNGRENITDAVKILRYIFGREAGPFCDDAVDTDDNGAMDVTDAVFLLGYLLRPESPFLPDPLSDCGPDPTDDSLSCAGPTSCK